MHHYGADSGPDQIRISDAGDAVAFYGGLAVVAKVGPELAALWRGVLVTGRKCTVATVEQGDRGALGRMEGPALREPWPAFPAGTDKSRPAPHGQSSPGAAIFRSVLRPQSPQGTGDDSEALRVASCSPCYRCW